ncbi:hypothetical protein JG687_00017789, partial [Phytophthora cactorum]
AKLYWVLENDYINCFANRLAPGDRHCRVLSAAFGVLGAAHALQFVESHRSFRFALKLTVRTVNFGSDSLSFVCIILDVGQYTTGKHRVITKYHLNL